MLMPMSNHGTMEDMDMDGLPTATMARGLPTQNPPPMLMPRLNHGITAATDMDGPIMVTLITVRGPLMPSPNRGGMAATEHMPGPTMVTPTGVKLIGPKHRLKHSPRTMLRDNTIFYK